MKILVTGCNGQLGTEMRLILEERMPGISDYTDVAELDLTDAEAVDTFIEKGGYTHLVNCAAYTAVDLAEGDGARACQAVNVDAVQNIASAAYNHGVRVIHISTDYVFDGTAHRPYKECDKVNPTSRYGTTKRKGEMVLLAMAPDSVILRTAWLYSPHGKNFVKTMLRLGRERKTLSVVADQIGTPTSAADLAEAIYTVLMSPQWIPGIYNFTDEGVASWYDFTVAIHRIAGIGGCKVSPVSTEEYPTPAARPAYSVLDKTLFKKTFSVDIPHWEESLRKVIAKLENRPSSEA